MKRVTGFLAAVLILSGVALFAPLNVNRASAQITIQLGGDFGRAKRSLVATGYTQIRLVGQGFTKFHVEACQNGIRYWFKSDSRGRVNQKRKIGVCQSMVTIEQVRQILASQGYFRINIEDRGGTYVAVACYGNDRVRVNVNYLGGLGNRRILGTCRQSLSPSDVSASLQREGYTRIKFIRRQLPVYVAEACLGKRKYQLELNRFAETLSQKLIGNCRGPIDPRRLVRILEDRGFSRVIVIDDRLPRYVAEVCKGRKRIELTLNRYGDIIERFNTGSCSPRVDRRQIVDGMRSQGFTRINIKREDNRGYMVEACYSGQSIRIEFNTYGELLNERELGPCQRLSIKQVKDNLANRNFRDLEFYVQGCNRGRLIRFKVDEFGDRSNRQVLGRCK